MENLEAFFKPSLALEDFPELQAPQIIWHGTSQSAGSGRMDCSSLLPPFLLPQDLLIFCSCRQQLDTKMERLRERLKTMSQQAGVQGLSSCFSGDQKS